MNGFTGSKSKNIQINVMDMEGYTSYVLREYVSQSANFDESKPMCWEFKIKDDPISARLLALHKLNQRTAFLHMSKMYRKVGLEKLLQQKVVDCLVTHCDYAMWHLVLVDDQNTENCIYVFASEASAEEKGDGWFHEAAYLAAFYNQKSLEQ